MARSVSNTGKCVLLLAVLLAPHGLAELVPAQFDTLVKLELLPAVNGLLKTSAPSHWDSSASDSRFTTRVELEVPPDVNDANGGFGLSEAVNVDPAFHEINDIRFLLYFFGGGQWRYYVYGADHVQISQVQGSPNYLAGEKFRVELNEASGQMEFWRDFGPGTRTWTLIATTASLPTSTTTLVAKVAMVNTGSEFHQILIDQPVTYTGSCGPISATEIPGIDVTTVDCDGTLPGEDCAYECMSGYTASAANVQCPLANDPTWTGPFPTCDPDACTVEPTFPSQGTFDCGTGSAAVPHGQTCTVSCLPGLAPLAPTTNGPDCSAGSWQNLPNCGISDDRYDLVLEQENGAIAIGEHAIYRTPTGFAVTGDLSVGGQDLVQLIADLQARIVALESA